MVLCHDNGVHVYAQVGHEVESAKDHVRQLDGDPLRLTRALDLPVLSGEAHPVTDAGVFTIFRGKGTRPVYERLPLPVFLESLGELGVDQAKGLRDGGRGLPPPMSDRVLVDFLPSWLMFISFSPSLVGVGCKTLRIYKAIKGRFTQSVEAALSWPFSVAAPRHT